MADPDGYDCPAAAPLCLCGIRGCALAELHATAFVAPRRSDRGRLGKQMRNGRRKR